VVPKILNPYLVCFLICFINLFCSYTSQEPKTPKLDNFGRLEISNWDFQKDGLISLEEGWEFFWNSSMVEPGIHIEPSQELGLGCHYSLTSHQPTHPNCNGYMLSQTAIQILNGNTQGIPVPAKHKWDGYLMKDGTQLPKYGRAIYKISIHSPERLLTFYAKTHLASSSARVWIRQKDQLTLLTKRGHPSIDLESTKPLFGGTIASFYHKDFVTDIYIEIVNFHNRNGFMGEVYRLGEEFQIQEIEQGRTQLSAFIIGTIFMSGTIFLFIYLRKRDQSYVLYFVILCWVVSLRMALIERLLVNYYKDYNIFTYILKFEYATLPIGTILFMKYLGMIGVNWKTRFEKSVFMMNALSLSLAIFLPVKIMTSLLAFFQFVLVFSIITIQYRLIFRNFESSTENLKVVNKILISFFALAFFSVFDILRTRYYFNFPELTGLGILVFIVGQAMILSQKSSNK
jgi:hypothetical protein